MGHFVFSLLFSVFILSYSPSETDFFQAVNVSRDITAALEKGSAKEVSEFFGTNVDLKIPGSDGTFSKNQAELLLRDFFKTHPPEKFTIGHQGSSNDGSVYVIGHFKSQNNNTFRTYFLLKKISGKMILHQLQFEIQ